MCLLAGRSPVVVTGKKGTLKRKAQLQELIMRTEMGYSDDLLDLTPFREKTVRVPVSRTAQWYPVGLTATITCMHSLVILCSHCLTTLYRVQVHISGILCESMLLHNRTARILLVTQLMKVP